MRRSQTDDSVRLQLKDQITKGPFQSIYVQMWSLWRVYSPSCLLVCAYDTKASKGSSSTHQGERSQHWVANHLSKTSVVCLSETVKGATRLLRLSIFGEIPELRKSKVLT